MKKIIALAFLLVALNPTLVFATSHTTTTPPIIQQPPATTTTQATTDFPIYQGVDGSIKDYLCTPSAVADGRDLERCINRLYRFGISAGALVLVFMVVAAGYLYITGGETGKGKGKAMLMNSLVGMGILLGSYVLLYFINPTLVAFKPIQPPIFDAQDLPDCEKVGFGVDCIIAGDEEDAINTTSGNGTAIACPNGLIDYDRTVPANGNPASAKICRAMMDKLKALHAKHKIIVTSTIRSGGALSLCHKTGNEKSGTCADMASGTGDWDSLCKAIKEVGGLKFLNESGSDSPNCGKFVKTKYWTGPHLHVNLVGG